MVTDAERRLIEQSLDALRDGDAGFVVREPQMKMIEAASEAFAAFHESGDVGRRGRNVSVIQAPTGTGKTVGAALPGIVLAKSRGRRLVISSSTVALQNQLLQKDLPMLAAAIPGGFTYTVAKGRGRYACTVKLHDRAGKAAQTSLALETDSASETSKNVESLATLIDMARKHADGEWDGDRDAWPQHVDDELWSSLVTDRLGCSGNRCPQFGMCGFHWARARVKESLVIVTNHDLLLAALTMPAGAVLPDPAESFYIVDECHNLTAVAVDHFARRHTLKGAVEWLGKVADGVQDVVHALSLDAHYLADAEQLARSLSDSLLALYSAIDRIGALEEKVTRRFRNGLLPRWVRDLGENIHGASSSLLGTLTDLRQLILEKAVLEPRLAPKLLSEQGFFLGKLEAMVETWDVLLEEDVAGEPPAARWLERHENSSGESDFMVCGSPITAAGMLDQYLWRRAAAFVLTSATITSCGSFSLFLRESGLDRFPDRALLQLDSPFDYASQAELVVPRMRSDPRCPPEHTAEIVEVLPNLVPSGGVLMLFSSARQMRDVFAMIPETLRADVLMQGSMQKHAILQTHRERISAGKRSVIFGLAATWGEGVDLPGDLCTHVVLARLAFKRPNSPLEEARHEWVESQGRSAFLEICVPEVGIRLAQSVGRLIRTHTDSGRVTVLDRRLAASRWGRQLLKGLPPFALKLFPPPERAKGLKRDPSRVV